MSGRLQTMDRFEGLFLQIEDGFSERKLNAQVFETQAGEEILILIGKDFLDMFDARDGLMVADEFLSPRWGKYHHDNLDRLPYWVARVKYKMVDKSQLYECLERLAKAMEYHKRRTRN
jgi:hypothetical protein